MPPSNTQSKSLSNTHSNTHSNEGRSPLRELMQSGRSITDIKKEEIPPIAKSHFEKALSRVRASVQQSELEEYERQLRQLDEEDYPSP